MSHTIYTQGNWGNSQLLVVGSQIRDLTFDPSFGHNLCFRCPNGSCEPILDIYVPRFFQWYRELFNTLGFDPCNCSLKICESTETPTPKVGVPLGVWGFIPSHPFTPLGAWDVTLGLPLGPHLCKPLPWLLTRSQVTGWNPLEGSTKSSCGKLRLGGTLPASNSRKG
jgi:hypothetical protein